MRIHTYTADDIAPQKPVRRSVPKSAQDAFDAALKRNRPAQPQPQQGQKANVAQKADKSGASRQTGNANGKQTVFASKKGVNDGLQADGRSSKVRNAKDDGLDDDAETDELGMGGDGMFVAQRSTNDPLEDEMAAFTGVDPAFGEFADLGLATEEGGENWSFSEAALDLFASGTGDAIWATDGSPELSDLAGGLAPLAGDDGIFEVFLPNGGKLGVVVNSMPNMVRIHLSPDNEALGARLRRRRMELQGELGRHTDKDVEITVL